MTSKWAPQTRYTLRRNAASIIKFDLEERHPTYLGVKTIKKRLHHFLMTKPWSKVYYNYGK